MVFALAIVGGFAFGAGDQYLGSLASLGAWAPATSLLSAPWLILPFLFGCTQRDGRRAAIVGLVASIAGLMGYFLMIMSPFEGGHSAFTVRELHGLLGSNLLNIAGALVTGPLYGWLGQRWRERRALVSAALVAGALMLEPAVLHAVGRSLPSEPYGVPLAEVLCGAALGAYFLLQHRRFLRANVKADRPETG